MDNNYKTPQDGDTPLLRASLRGHAAVVRLLLESGANVNIRDQVCISDDNCLAF